MEIITVKDLSFKYILSDHDVINKVNLKVNEGDFMVICGESGCGKTTLLRHLKKELTPYGTTTGEVLYQDKPLIEIDLKTSATNIGYVMQNPDNQIVTDKVWHELAFGLENIGEKRTLIKRRVAEMANFFGLNELFRMDSDVLSGGQKQVLNLASTMLLQPKVLILDEPTSQLDPIAAVEFIDNLKKLNDEFSITIILVEHRLEEIFKVANKVVVMDKGEIIAQGNPYTIAREVKKVNTGHSFLSALPTPMKVALSLNLEDELPLTIKEGKQYLKKYFNNASITRLNDRQENILEKEIISLKNVYFRYQKNEDDILRGVNLNVYQGELYCLLGGNGTGKTTTINNIVGLNRPYRGKVLINQEDINKRGNKLPDDFIGYLPQNPTLLFARDSVKADLLSVFSEKQQRDESVKQELNNLITSFKIQDLLEQHPYDLSGGEQQKVALIKILLKKPQLLLLDEPTKGLDASAKTHLASLLNDLRVQGITIMIVSHDIEFCAEYGTRCAMFFDGEVISEDYTHEFFKDNNFYTTAATKLSRDIFEDTILCQDVIKLCQANLK